jgi:hypothetical protein
MENQSEVNCILNILGFGFLGSLIILLVTLYQKRRIERLKKLDDKAKQLIEIMKSWSKY